MKFIYLFLKNIYASKIRNNFLFKNDKNKYFDLCAYIIVVS